MIALFETLGSACREWFYAWRQTGGWGAQVLEHPATGIVIFADVDMSPDEALLGSGQVTAEQAEQFRRHGAVGLHLENLERNDGCKRFNQDGVSEIVADTDPRRQVVLALA